MTTALHIALGAAGPRIVPPAPVPVEALLLNRKVEEAALLLPRIFGLCRAAQSLGARAALGLPVRPADRTALADEILREHLMRFFVFWPRRLGLPSTPLPAQGRMAEAVFGPVARCPGPGALDDWLASGAGVAPVLAAIAVRFGPGEAVADLPAATADSLASGAAQENSPWLRHRDSSLLAGIAARFGRGPLWRAAGRLVDLEACLTGRLAPEADSRPGPVLVPTARGICALSARVREGRVSSFRRWTPTDHLLAPRGVLERALASLPRARVELAPLVVDILDPCLPVHFEEAADA
ncbi:hypothetical protein NHU_03190 [Rhodovulum sulfidophilum]|uniref:Hydrogenase expression/formation protein HupK n=1 Tax=Rhodovulum sulfidophilum TaxID=35806 RepID=A0A0D6B5B0_RHOSU|nr:hypothetical protein NHU_03190 [Rhodovulum sulfidophilum]